MIALKLFGIVALGLASTVTAGSHTDKELLKEPLVEASSLVVPDVSSRETTDVCLWPRTVQRCNRDGKCDVMHQCPPRQCCAQGKGHNEGYTFCSRRACKFPPPKTDDHLQESPQFAMTPPPDMSVDPIKEHAEKLPAEALAARILAPPIKSVCKDRPFGWFCASTGATGFCNKLGMFVDGELCDKGECCALSHNGTAICTKQACEIKPSKPPLHKAPPVRLEEAEQEDAGTM